MLTAIAWRTDGNTCKNGPKSWADFWDVQKFPGRRAFHKHPIDMLEIALLADGVPKDKIYPIDMDRAFKKLDEIKPHVQVWWTGGAQTTQMLQSGEVDMLPTWNGRAQVVIDAGGPVEIEWNQGLFALEGWVIPKGDPQAALGKKFIKYCANAKRQAEFVSTVNTCGPDQSRGRPMTTSREGRAGVLLPTAPDNFKKLIQSNNEWWGKNKEKALEPRPRARYRLAAGSLLAVFDGCGACFETAALAVSSGSHDEAGW